MPLWVTLLGKSKSPTLRNFSLTLTRCIAPMASRRRWIISSNILRLTPPLKKTGWPIVRGSRRCRTGASMSPMPLGMMRRQAASFRYRGGRRRRNGWQQNGAGSGQSAWATAIQSIRFAFRDRQMSIPIRCLQNWPTP